MQVYKYKYSKLSFFDAFTHSLHIQRNESHLHRVSFSRAWALNFQNVLCIILNCFITFLLELQTVRVCSFNVSFAERPKGKNETFHRAFLYSKVQFALIKMIPFRRNTSTVNCKLCYDSLVIIRLVSRQLRNTDRSRISPPHYI